MRLGLRLWCGRVLEKLFLDVEVERWGWGCGDGDVGG